MLSSTGNQQPVTAPNYGDVKNVRADIEHQKSKGEKDANELARDTKAAARDAKNVAEDQGRRAKAEAEKLGKVRCFEMLLHSCDRTSMMAVAVTRSRLQARY